MKYYLDLFNQYFNQQLINEDINVKYVLLNNGKRFRPMLTIGWCLSAGGKVEDALPLAAAIECIHTMSLIQDDLPCMDNATERRGQMCLHLKTNEANAILISDYLFQLAYKFILHSSLSNSNKITALNILTTAISDTIVGQQYELSTEITTIEDYLSLHKQKTAALLTAACKFGIIAADKEQLLNQAHIFGESLGIGYQIYDDIQDSDGITTITDEKSIKFLL